MCAATVYSIGYEGLALEEFIGRIKAKGVTRVVDVRGNPFSRKKGFSKAALQETFESEGIEYVHMQELGTPDGVKKAYKAGGSLETFLEGYAEHIDSVGDEFERLVEYAEGKTTAIICFESSYIRCHRKVLIDRLEQRGLRYSDL